VYSFKEHQRLDETKYLYGATIIIGIVWSLKDNLCYKAYSAEGILTLHDPEMRKLYDLKVASRADRLLAAHSNPADIRSS
jgi:uridine kinase